jgi:hypothetical protein
MANLDFADFDGRLRQLRLMLDLRLHRRLRAVAAAAIASLTIIVVAAAMMTQL